MSPALLPLASMLTLAWGGALGLFNFGGAAAIQADGSPAAHQPEGQPALREFVPGIRIDWTAKTVLIDAKVILRKGPLELVACSPRTREHESILLVSARPLHIYQALGLIGLQPGKPLSFDEKNDRWLPPSGDRLDILAHFNENGAKRIVPIAQWLEVVETKLPPERIDWIFAGSLKLPDGRFAADIEGTIICVVDFEAALIAVRDLHTADNELLWLRARTEAIPPVGTPVTLLIRAAQTPASSPPEKPGVETRPAPGDNPRPDGGHPDKEPN